MSKPSESQLEDRKLTRQALIVVPLVMAAGLGGLFVFDRFRAKHGHGEGLALVRIDDDTLLAVEAVSTSAITHDVNTGIQSETGWTDYRLRTIDVHTGHVVATRVVGDGATCRAGRGRAWCWWKGTLRLLDRKLATVAEGKAWRHDALRAGYDVKTAVAQPDGTLALLGNDGYPVALDPTTLAIAPITSLPSSSAVRCGGGLVPSVAVSGHHYQLGTLGARTDEERLPLTDVTDLTHSKVRTATVNWLGGAFVDTECTPAAPTDALFIVSRTLVDKQSPHQLSRVRVDGTAAWTVALPETPSFAYAIGDVIVLSGSAHMVALAADTGATRWNLHQ